jgi:hypothetical protein
LTLRRQPQPKPLEAYARGAVKVAAAAMPREALEPYSPTATSPMQIVDPQHGAFSALEPFGAVTAPPFSS